MSWLEEHIETFVKPNIECDDSTLKPLGYFTQEELTVIKNIWRSVKKNAKGRQILLPGRDVFIFEVLARRENYPTVFSPECSRMTVRHLMEKWWNMRDLYLFDTGFAGSIPRNLRTKRFGLMSHAVRDSDNQIFPRLTMSRGLALKIESTPKYWESARMVDEFSISGYHVIGSAIHQDMSSPSEFLRAACLTIEIYTNSAPKFVNYHRPIPRERGAFSW
jgi:hypothetical protein